MHLMARARKKHLSTFPSYWSLLNCQRSIFLTVPLFFFAARLQYSTAQLIGSFIERCQMQTKQSWEFHYQLAFTLFFTPTPFFNLTRCFCFCCAVSDGKISPVVESLLIYFHPTFTLSCFAVLVEGKKSWTLNRVWKEIFISIFFFCMTV